MSGSLARECLVPFLMVLTHLSGGLTFDCPYLKLLRNPTGFIKLPEERWTSELPNEKLGTRWKPRMAWHIQLNRETGKKSSRYAWYDFN